MNSELKLSVAVLCGALLLACGGRASTEVLSGASGASNVAGGFSAGGALSAGVAGASSVGSGGAAPVVLGDAGDAGAGGSVDNVGSVVSSGDVTTHCDLEVTDASNSNVPVTRFYADHGNGMSVSAAGAALHSFNASTVTPDTGYVFLVLTFHGAWPVVGATYTLDSRSANAQTSLLFAQGEPAARAWEGVSGGTLTVRGIRQTALPAHGLYTEVTFELSDVELQPSADTPGSDALGNFKFSGLCDGNFSDVVGGE